MHIVIRAIVGTLIGLLAFIMLRPDPILAKYTSVGSGRSDGGATLTFYASGRLISEGSPIGWRGRYESSSTGFVTRLKPRHLLSVLTAAQQQSLIRYVTNGNDYLLMESEYRALMVTGDTNRLRHALHRER